MLFAIENLFSLENKLSIKAAKRLFSRTQEIELTMFCSRSHCDYRKEGYPPRNSLHPFSSEKFTRLRKGSIGSC